MMRCASRTAIFIWDFELRSCGAGCRRRGLRLSSAPPLDGSADLLNSRRLSYLVVKRPQIGSVISEPRESTYQSTPTEKPACRRKSGRKMTASERLTLLKEILAERILVLDGATGTSIQAMGLHAEDFGGPKLEGCNENLVRTRPDAIRRLHDSFLEVGADMVETDTFGGTSVVLAEYGLENDAYDLNVWAAKIAREAADAYSTPDKPRFVAGSMGPTTKSISVTATIGFDALAASYQEQA